MCVCYDCPARAPLGVLFDVGDVNFSPQTSPSDTFSDPQKYTLRAPENPLSDIIKPLSDHFLKSEKHFLKSEGWRVA